MDKSFENLSVKSKIKILGDIIIGPWQKEWKFDIKGMSVLYWQLVKLRSYVQ